MRRLHYLITVIFLMRTFVISVLLASVPFVQFRIMIMVTMFLFFWASLLVVYMSRGISPRLFLITLRVRYWLMV